jgi:ankyrin repeat protein
MRIRLILIPALCAASFAATNTDTRLVDAVKAGNKAAANTMIEQHADVNTPELDGTTALHWAVHQDDLTLVDRLLRAGANAKASNRYGITPLAEAAVIGNPAMIGKLLKAGADANEKNGDGQTPLMAVARTGNVESARLLLDRGADVNAKENWRGQTALMWAAVESLPAMVKELASHGADLNARSKVNNWERDVTAEPRRKYMPLGGWTPLLFAARQGCLECAKILAEAGADLNLQDPDGVSPCVTAAVNGHYDVAAYLIEKGADVNLADHWGRAALWAAVDMHTLPHSTRPDAVESESVSSTDLLKVVLAHGADVNAPLVLFPPYRSLGDRGSDNILTIGATPLVRAAKAGDATAIRWLLEKSADPNIANINGTTPLLAAAGLGSRDSDTRGRYKTESDGIESAKLLLDAGADIHAADDRGQTVLHGAAFWGWSRMVQLLADRGAKLDAKDKKGMTPIDSAMGRNGGNGFGGNRIDIHEDTAALLKKLMAAGAPSAQNSKAAH